MACLWPRTRSYSTKILTLCCRVACGCGVSPASAAALASSLEPVSGCQESSQHGLPGHFVINNTGRLLFRPPQITCVWFKFCIGVISGIYSRWFSLYWAIQAGLLTPLTFARHRLSPLAAFTSGAYFLHNGRRWRWICEFYTANFKGIFGGP